MCQIKIKLNFHFKKHFLNLKLLKDLFLKKHSEDLIIIFLGFLEMKSQNDNFLIFK